MIKVTSNGDFTKTIQYFQKARNLNVERILRNYGQKGVDVLRDATPKDTSNTADSWSFEIKKTARGYDLSWRNSSISEGVPIVILLQYGHMTRGGTYVQGRDFINPAMRPIFTSMAEEIFKEVKAI